MSQTARQRVPLTDSQNWLRLDDTAKLTGESIRTWRRKAEWEARQALQENREALASRARAGYRRLQKPLYRGLESRRVAPSGCHSRGTTDGVSRLGHPDDIDH